MSSLARVSAGAQAEPFCSQHSRAGPPTPEFCGGNIFNHSKAIVCLVQQHGGALCSPGQLQRGFRLDLLLIDALHVPLHTLGFSPEKPNSLDFTGGTVNVRSFCKPLLALVPAEWFLGDSVFTGEVSDLLIWNSLSFIPKPLFQASTTFLSSAECSIICL